MRGTAIERSQSRQRKLDRMDAWYFELVMESLSLMLQISLLLLGCALSRYLWEINITVASVVLGVTLFGTIFYLFIIVAGTVSEDCPYQTPSARILRHALLPALRLAPSVISKCSTVGFFKLSGLIQDFGFRRILALWWSSFKRPWYSPNNLIPLSAGCIVLLVGPVAGAGSLGVVISVMPVLLFGRTMYHQIMDPSSLQTDVPDQHTIASDLRCISWVLQTSLDKMVRLTALKGLAPLLSVPTNFDPALVAYCFDAFVSCVVVENCKVMVVQGLEQLATVSAECFFHTFSHLWVTDPTSSTLQDVHQRYTKVFPANTDFCGHQFSHTANAIHRVFIRSGDPQRFKWGDYKPPVDEHAIVARTLIKVVRFKYQTMRQGKVSRLILRFALHSLSLDPLPPTPIVADCLSIIAVDLDCDVSNTSATTLDEKYVHISQMTISLTVNQCAGGGSFESDSSETQNNG